jgi:non-ribosomal peptide synthetase component F
MALLAGFGVLLHRETGADDVVVATDAANRQPRETEDLIGLFLNQLVLRLELSGDPGFAEVLERVRSTALEAYAHASDPFELVVSAVRPRRNPHIAPLAQVKLNLQNLPSPIRQSPQPTDGDTAGPSLAGNMDLTLFLSDEKDGLHGLLVYDARLFDAIDADRLANDYRDVLGELVRDLGDSDADPVGLEAVSAR